MGTMPPIPFMSGPQVPPQDMGPLQGPPAPTLQNPQVQAPIPQQDANQKVAVPAQPITPQQAQVVHSAVIGHGFKSLLNAMSGSSTQWQQTPNGPVPVRVKNAPGQLFKNILAGAIMGGAAGGSVPGSETAGAGWMGAAKGAGAAMQAADLRNQQAQQQAQKQFENQQTVNRENREQQLAQAQIANMQAETVARQHQIDLLDDENHMKHNQASAALYDALKSAGGIAPVDGKLPEDLTAYQLAQDYTKDPSIRQAPAGYSRHFLDKTDSSEVTWNGQHWTHPDGTPADMTDKTSIQVLDVPDDVFNKRVDTLGSDINKIFGQKLVDPDKHYQLSPHDKIGLYNQFLKNQAEIAKTKATERAAAAQERANANESLRLKQNEYNAAYEQVKTDNENLQKTISDPNNFDANSKAQAQAKITENNQRLKQLYEQLYPDAKLPENETPPPPDPVAQLFGAAQKLPPDKVEAMINNAPVSAKQKKEALQRYKDWQAQQPQPKPAVVLNPMGQAVKSAAQKALELGQTVGVLP